jgi:2-hydroxychromene-2-carboxylate isomerase
MAGSSTGNLGEPRSGLLVKHRSGAVSPGGERSESVSISRSGERSGPAFYFDLAVPEAYLAAERILSLMPVACEWIPVFADDLPGGGWGAWRCANERDIELSEIERVAAARGLQPMRWPGDLPFDSTLAMRAATYAKGAGKTVAFSLAAFRQAFAGGRSLAEEDNVALAGAACEIHPRALLQGIRTRSVIAGLERATALAGERGVRTVPAVWTPDEVFHGDRAIEAAAAALAVAR